MRIIKLQIELFTENGHGYVASLFGTPLFIILDPPLKRKKKNKKKNNKKILRTVEERVGMIKCVVCGEKEEDDVNIEDWVACEMCSQWIHSKCIPSNHPYSISHADFHCHICLQ